MCVGPLSVSGIAPWGLNSSVGMGRGSSSSAGQDSLKTLWTATLCEGRGRNTSGDRPVRRVRVHWTVARRATAADSRRSGSGSGARRLRGARGDQQSSRGRPQPLWASVCCSALCGGYSRLKKPPPKGRPSFNRGRILDRRTRASRARARTGRNSPMTANSSAESCGRSESEVVRRTPSLMQLQSAAVSV